MSDGIDFVIYDSDLNVVETVYKLPDGGPPMLLAVMRERVRVQRRLERLAVRNLRRELSYVNRIQAARARAAIAARRVTEPTSKRDEGKS